MYIRDRVTNDGVKTTAKESDFEIKYADNITGKKVTAGKENIGYIYAVAKEGTGFAGTKTIVTSDGTIINGVVAYIPFTIKSVKFVAKNVSVKNATYAGGLPVKPEVLIQIGGSTLVEGKDYTLRLIDKNGNTVTPIDVTVGDIYGVEIKGINGYTESGVATFDTDDVDSTAYSRAVSYTHLDVYKRQEETTAGTACIETFLAQHFIRNGYALSYWSSGNQAEVPFLLSKNSHFIAIDYRTTPHQKCRNLMQLNKSSLSPAPTQMYLISAEDFRQKEAYQIVPLYAVFCI